MRRLFSVMCTLALIATGIGCGGDDDLQRAEVPELVIEGTTGQDLIKLPPDDARHQTQPTTAILKNTGKVPLKVTKFEWVAKPDRLDAIGERGDACADDSECGDGICLSNTCTALGLPATPFEITPGLQEQVSYVLSKGAAEIDCPAAPADLPDDVIPSRYCGEISLVTNATNDSGIVEGGKARLFFLKPGSSGTIEVTPSFIGFEQVQPGSPQEATVSVQNTGSQTLSIFQVVMTTRANLFRIEGPNTPTEIEPNATETWTVTVDVPDGTAVEDYVGFTELFIDSSATNASSGKIPVEVAAGAGNAPVIEVTPLALSFDPVATQDITINNTGDATLQVTSLAVNPPLARPFYRFMLDGNDVTDNFPVQNVVKGETITINVVFARPASNTDSSVGVLSIGHNDKNANFRSEVTLLGDAGDVPIARMYPTGFTFLAADGNTETRDFVIRNVGTADLVVSDVAYNFSVGSESEFTVTGFNGTIPPGGIQSGTVTFAGSNATPDVGVAIFTTNDASADLTLNIKDLDTSAEAVTAVVTPVSSNDASVGTPAVFNGSASLPAGSAAGGIWTLTSRPAASAAFFNATGEEMRFTPDVAGDYKFTLLINSQQREDQAVHNLTVVP